MNEAQKRIDEAFSYISSIPVAGDNVELMAAAKESLRAAYKLAGDGKSDDAAAAAKAAADSAKRAEASTDG